MPPESYHLVAKRIHAESGNAVEDATTGDIRSTRGIQRTHRQRPCLLSSTSCSSSRNSSEWIVLSRDMMTSPTSCQRVHHQSSVDIRAWIEDAPGATFQATPPYGPRTQRAYPAYIPPLLTCLLAMAFEWSAHYLRAFVVVGWLGLVVQKVGAVVSWIYAVSWGMATSASSPTSSAFWPPPRHNHHRDSIGKPSRPY